jgi:alkylated DNA nucleotide flippase Atl1
MHVQEIRLQQVLEGAKQYRVPLYQRTYAWSTKQLSRLWSDLVQLTETREQNPHATHFTGSLVLATGEVGPGGAEFLVVDGQQRLTTLSLLLAALRDHVAKTEPDDPAKVARIHESFLVDRFKQGDARLKLLPTQADRDIFRAIVDQAVPDAAQSGILDAYRFFRTRLAEADDPDDPHDIDKIASAALDGLVFVSITAGIGDNVYRIFESLNNTGMKLTQGDLLRNYVFMRVGDRGEEVYTSVWMPMQSLVSSNDLEALFWMDLTWSNPVANQGDIYGLQAERLATFSADEVEQEVRRYARLAELLADMRDPQRVQHPGLRTRLERLLAWGASAADPLVLKLLSLAEGDPARTDDVVHALAILESYFVRRLLVSAAPNALSRILLRAAGELDAARPSSSLHRYLSTGRKFFATDRQIVEAVVSKPFYYSGRPHQRKLVLAWLEEQLAGKEPASLEAATIEHVMPQTLTDDWRAELAGNLGEYATADDFHEAYLHTLANVTLSAYNSELSNAPFASKRVRLASSNIALNAAIASEPAWGDRQIQSRGARLAKLVAETWVAPLAETEAIESGAAWSRVADALAAIPRGRWTSYGAIAAIAGTHPVPLGAYLANTPALPHAWRVLQAGGAVSPGFRWSDNSPNAGRDPIEVLTAEGVRFDASGRARPDDRIDGHELAQLIGLEFGDGSDDEASESDEAENAFLQKLADRFPPASVHGVTALLDAWRSLGGRVEFSAASAFLQVHPVGSPRNIWPAAVNDYGTVEVVFQWLSYRAPFDDRELRDELRRRLNAARGVEIPESKLDVRPPFSIDALADESNRTRIVDALEWFIDVVHEFETASAPAVVEDADLIRFTLAGVERELSRDLVRTRLQELTPDRILTYWVDVAGVRWPVKQALSLCLDLDSSQFQSWDARRRLAALGFAIGSTRDA